MKKILLLLFILSISSIPIYSQKDIFLEEEITEDTIQTTDEKTGTVISKNQYFELELKRGVQNPITKKIPFTVYITPKIDSSKTQILWNVPSVFQVFTNHPDFVSLNKNQVYSFSASFKPEQEGKYDITVNVISWQFDSNRSNSASYNITVDESFVLQPVDAMYNVYIGLIILGILAVAGLAIFLTIRGLKHASRKTKAWLTPPY